MLKNITLLLYCCLSLLVLISGSRFSAHGGASRDVLCTSLNLPSAAFLHGKCCGHLARDVSINLLCSMPTAAGWCTDLSISGYICSLMMPSLRIRCSLLCEASLVYHVNYNLASASVLVFRFCRSCMEPCSCAGIFQVGRTVRHQRGHSSQPVVRVHPIFERLYTYLPYIQACGLSQMRELDRKSTCARRCPGSTVAYRSPRPDLETACTCSKILQTYLYDRSL